MFKSIFISELLYWLRKPVTYIYFVAFFGFALLSFMGTAGFFDPPPPNTSKLVRVVNSPYEISYMLQYFTKIFMFLLPAVIGASIYKDYKYQMYSIVYTFPIDKLSYLLAKFLSAFCTVAFISFSVGIAFLIGEHLPRLHENKIGTFLIEGYLQAYLLYVLPTLFFFGIIVFALVALTRSIYAGFILVIVLFLFQLIVENALGGKGYVYAMSILDPFAQNTKEFAIQDWTLADKNTKIIPISMVVVLNRIFWLAISVMSFVMLYRKFSFSEHGLSLTLKKKNKTIIKKESFGKVSKVKLSLVDYDFSWKQELKTIWHLSRVDLKYIVRNWMFLVLVFFGIIAVLFAIAKVTNFDDIALLPVTRVVLLIPAMFYIMIMILATFLYAGILIHRSRIAKMNQLLDVTPVSNGVFMFSKVLALLKMQIILLFLLMAAGIIIQVYNGYYNFEVGLYLFQLYVVTFPVLIIWSFAAVFIQSLFKNPYLGLFILIIGWVGVGGLPNAGITSNLLLFNSPPKTNYSDMNGYAETLAPYFLVEGYWFVFGLILLLLIFLFWVRGLPQSFKERFQIFKVRLKPSIGYILGLLVICFTVLGFKIYKEEHDIKWDSISSNDQNNILENFKDSFERYSKIVQPRIISMNLKLDIFPETNSFEAEGNYVLVNKSEKTIDTILVKTGFDEITQISLTNPAQLIAEDTLMKFQVLKLQQSLFPGDSTNLSFKVKNTENSLFERNSNILKNGTFLLNDLFPRLGYSFNEDKKHPDDSLALQNNYAAIDSDLIDFEATISTSKDQIALAPGYLVKEWEENDRKYFNYKTSSKIKYVLGINSGRFTSHKENYKGVELQLYHHPSHTYNLSQMMEGLKAALDYNTKYFGPYQHRQARIIEFPDSEGSYATTMANSIPMSEIRFIANTNTSDDKVDLAFYVAAHELTHQWWGNQVIGADVLGARMLSESITEYITLNIYREKYGEEVALQFLKKQRKRYLKGRRNEVEKEPPLSLASEQQYIFYGKGAMAFNAMRHYLGQQKLNLILKNFLEGYKLQEGPPYPTSLELVERMKDQTPDSLQYVIKDFFETVTFYDNKIEKAKVEQMANGKYRLEIDLFTRKYKDAMLEDTLALSDYVEIGVFNADNTLIKLESVKIIKERNRLVIMIDEDPTKLIIDPNFILIDKNIDDNEMDL
ncbi:MAG: ABC transporter permease/M1 family aminopeptidase [Maribacter sp.]